MNIIWMQGRKMIYCVVFFRSYREGWNRYSFAFRLYIFRASHCLIKKNMDGDDYNIDFATAGNVTCSVALSSLSPACCHHLQHIIFNSCILLLRYSHHWYRLAALHYYTDFQHDTHCYYLRTTFNKSERGREPPSLLFFISRRAFHYSKPYILLA